MQTPKNSQMPMGGAHDIGRRNVLKSGLVAAGAGLVGGLPAYAQHNASGDTSFDPSMYAGDLAIVNARIITMNPAQPEAEAVLVRWGRIVAVGTNAQIREAAQGVKILDAGGRGVVPGFIDTHVHIEWSCAAEKLMLNFWDNPPATIAETLARLKAKAAKTPAGTWIIAEGPTGKEGRLPTLAELDSVSQRHPIAVFAAVHTNTANTLAAKMMGYLTYEDEAQARFWSNGERFTGGVVDRLPDGSPGVAHDCVMRLPRDVWSVNDLKGAIKDTIKPMFTAGGVTTAVPVCLVSSNEYSADQALQAEGHMPLRLRAYYMAPFSVGIDDVLDTGVTRGFGNDMFRTGGFKLIQVGGVKDGRRTYHYTQDELTDVMTKIHARGLQAIIHTTGDEAITQCILATEEVHRRFPNGPRIRHRLEHSWPSLPLAQRAKAAGMDYTLLSSQPGITPHAGKRMDRPFRSYLAAGIQPSFVSDQCGGFDYPKPMHSIADISNRSPGDGPDESVTFDDALKMWTIWPAYSTHEDHDKGSIAVGKLGDFAVLTGDPRRMRPEQYWDLKVAATILGGKLVYEA